MKLLAVSLQMSEVPQFKYRFFDVLRETSTSYKVAKPHELLNNRVHIRKDEVDKIIFSTLGEKKDCRGCDFGLHLQVWAIIESDEPNYDLLRYWRKTAKITAMEELKARNQVIKELYQKVIDL